MEINILDWIHIDQKMPNEVTPVLVYGECCDVCYQIRIAELEDSIWWESNTGEDLTFRPTHWMPLPEPPIS